VVLALSFLFTYSSVMKAKLAGPRPKDSQGTAEAYPVEPFKRLNKLYDHLIVLAAKLDLELNNEVSLWATIAMF
jgi:hypothetical protein